jgi:hypothetical protein
MEVEDAGPKEGGWRLAEAAEEKEREGGIGEREREKRDKQDRQTKNERV